MGLWRIGTGAVRPGDPAQTPSGEGRRFPASGFQVEVYRRASAGRFRDGNQHTRMDRGGAALRSGARVRKRRAGE